MFLMNLTNLKRQQHTAMLRLYAGFIQKVECQIKEFFLGETQFFKNIFGVSYACFTINRAISSSETKLLTEIGAVKM